MATTPLSSGEPYRPADHPVSQVNVEETPIKWWAFLGAMILTFILYIWGKWLLTAAVPVVLEPITDEDKALVKIFRVIEVSAVLAGILTLYFTVAKPLWRERRLTTTAVVMLCMPFMAFHDTSANAIVPWWAWSPYWINMGNWTALVPGVVNPTMDQIGEPLWIFLGYTWGLGYPIVLCVWLMRKWKQRHPRTRAMGLVFIGMAGGILYDLVLEIPFTALGGWTQFGAPRSLSIFPGTLWQISIPEIVGWGGMCGLCANVLYWTNAKGQPFVWRGVEKLKCSNAAKDGLRYLSLLAIFQLIIFCWYNIPGNVAALYSDAPLPQTPAHIIQKVCGEGTDYHCPGPDVPILRKSGLIITPDERLIRR
ncbi:MAG: spirocyclase AveC family protein [bacterium]